MRRLLRIAFAALAAASLLLCVVAAGVWGRSYFVADTVDATGDDGQWEIRSDAGHVTIFWVGFGKHGLGATLGYPWRHRRDSTGGDPFAAAELLIEHWDIRLPGAGFSSRGDNLSTFVAVVVHLGYVTALFSIVPLAWLVAFRRRCRRAARARIGFCAKCGYDLRASPGRCPECGAAAPASAA